MVNLHAIAQAGKLGVPFILPTKNGPRCAVAEMVTNNRLAPGQQVLQLRFACSCLCRLPAKKLSKNCRTTCRTGAPVAGGGQQGVQFTM